MTQSLSSFITDTHLAFSGFWDTVTSLKLQFGVGLGVTPVRRESHLAP